MTVIQHSLDTHVSHVLEMVSAFRQISIDSLFQISECAFVSGTPIWDLYSLAVKHRETQNSFITFIQRRTNVVDVGPTLYKCYSNVFVFAGHTQWSFKIVDLSMYLPCFCMYIRLKLLYRACILVQVTIYRRLLIGRDGHLQNNRPQCSTIVRSI